MLKLQEDHTVKAPEKEWVVSGDTDSRLIFAVHMNQFRRGMINIAGGEQLKFIEDRGHQRVVLERYQQEVVCRFRETVDDGIFVVFARYEYAAYFDDGLNY